MPLVPHDQDNDHEYYKKHGLDKLNEKRESGEAAVEEKPKKEKR